MTAADDAYAKGLADAIRTGGSTAPALAVSSAVATAEAQQVYEAYRKDQIEPHKVNSMLVADSEADNRP